MDYKVTDTELTSIANAIRTKGGTSEPLTFPNEFITAVQNIPTGGGTLQTKSKTYTPTASQQTESVQPDNGYDGLDKVNITVNAIDPNFIGSNVPRKSSADLTVSGKTVTAPSGYYSAQASKSVADGTEGTPTATKGTVSNHSVSVTPSVTNSAGYISGGTKTGDSVIVTANELASGNLPITENADNINVVGYAFVSVNVPKNLQTKTRTFTPTFSQQVEVIGPDEGYDGLNAVGITVEAVQMMSLPRTASLTSVGTRRARIYQSNATQYWNIPEGYHTEAEYYEVAPLNVAPKIITANGDYSAGDEDLDGYSSVTVDVQGGASNFITGTFTTGSTAGHTEITLPYTGNGYPITAVVVIDGGAYVSGTDWYDSLQRYAVGQWTMTKANMTTTPTYGTSGANNQGVTTWIYKNSTSTSTSYSRSSAMNTNVFSSSNAGNTAQTCVRFKGNTTLSYYVNTSSYGLHPEMTYRYFIVYSE